MMERAEKSKENITGAMLALVTCPVDEAGKLAREIVESGFAACVNVISGVHSVFRWQGKIEEGDEAALIIKTTAAAYDSLEGLIVDRHSYSCPEIIAVNIDSGLAAYLNWIGESVTCDDGGDGEQ